VPDLGSRIGDPIPRDSLTRDTVNECFEGDPDVEGTSGKRTIEVLAGSDPYHACVRRHIAGACERLSNRTVYLHFVLTR
jgi:hypothetical protein